MTTIITTGGRSAEKVNQFALQAAKQLGYTFVERKKRSIKALQKIYNANVLVAGIDRYELYDNGMEKPFFFHPNSAAFRLKRLLKGEKDPLIELSRLQEGDSFLDCTLGLGSDSIVAAFITGEKGSVLGIEANPTIAFITDKGLRSFSSSSRELTTAMKRVKVQQGDSVAVLKSLPDCSWDVVYIDPMFSEPIKESSNFTPLRQVGYHHILTDEWIEEAKRVSKRCVVVKEQYNSPVFKKFGMVQQVRPNTKFHYGIMDK